MNCSLKVSGMSWLKHTRVNSRLLLFVHPPSCMRNARRAAVGRRELPWQKGFSSMNEWNYYVELVCFWILLFRTIDWKLRPRHFQYLSKNCISKSIPFSAVLSHEFQFLLVYVLLEKFWRGRGRFDIGIQIIFAAYELDCTRWSV